MDAQPAQYTDDGELLVSARPWIPQDIVDTFVALALALPPGHLRTGSYYEDVWLDAKSFRKVHRSWRRESLKFLFETIFVSTATDWESLYDGNWFIHPAAPWWKVKEMLECEDIRLSVRHFGFHGDKVLDILGEVKTRCPGVRAVTFRAMNLKELDGLGPWESLQEVRVSGRVGEGRDWEHLCAFAPSMSHLTLLPGCELFLEDGVEKPLEVQCLSMEIRGRDMTIPFAVAEGDYLMRRPKANDEEVRIVKASVVDIVADEEAENVMGRLGDVLMGVVGMQVFKLNLTNVFPQDWSRGAWGTPIKLERHMALTRVEIAFHLWSADVIALLLVSLKGISALEVVKLKAFVVDGALWDMYHGRPGAPRRANSLIWAAGQVAEAGTATVHLLWMGVFVGSDRHGVRVRRESLRAMLGQLPDSLFSPVPPRLLMEFEEMDEVLEMSWDGTGRRALMDEIAASEDLTIASFTP